MTVSSLHTEERLIKFCEEYGSEPLVMELIAFWGRHPNARFSAKAISCALDCRKLHVQREMKKLAMAGLVETQTENGLMFYHLTEEDTKRQPVIELAFLGWDRLMNISKNLQQKKSATLYHSKEEP